MKLYFSRFKNEYNQEPPKNCCCCLVTKPCLTLCDLRNWAHQTPLSMGFIRQEYWSGLPFPPLGDLPDPGIKPESPVSCIDRCVLYHWATKETHLKIQFSSVQFSHSVMMDSLRPHETQHIRPPCPSPTPGVHPNSCPLNRWCHPNISSCRPLLLLPSIFPRIRVFSNESALRIRWPNYWSFSFNISPSNGILLSHKKEQHWVSSVVDEPRTYYTEWIKSERER